jgi:glycosyltransferase involved in cell wall biosynthesis
MAGLGGTMTAAAAQLNFDVASREARGHDKRRVMLHVALDTHPLYTTRAGAARYVRGLVDGLRRLASEVAVTEIAWPVENFGYAQPRRAWRTFYRECWWARRHAPRAVRAAGADVVHLTAPPFIPRLGLPEVVTLHDLAVLRFPGRFRSWQRRAGIRRLERLGRAERIICLSRFTADEGVHLLGLDPRRLEVVHLGGAWRPEDPERPPAGFTPPVEFLLFVGSLEPGKNLALLRDIYAAAGGRPLPPLVIVGSRWRGVPAEGTPPADWIYAGHQPDEVLRWLYRRARALVFPSLYEGFGLPVVEAMSLGCPVVCGPVASLPEVAGDAACLANLTPGEFGAAIRRVLQDAALADELRARGRRRAQAFTWERCAQETLAVYRQARGR